MNKTQLYEMISELLDETQWGGFTGGAAPLDEPPLDSGPMSPEQQQKVFDILVDTGSDPEELKASGDYPDVVAENNMKITNAQLLEIIKEELQKEIMGYDVAAVKVSHEAAEDLRASHEHMINTMELMEKAKQESVSDELKDEIQKLQDILLRGADAVRVGLEDLIGMETTLAENLDEIQSTNDTHYRIEPGQPIITDTQLEADRYSAQAALLQARSALKHTPNQEKAICHIKTALNLLGWVNDALQPEKEETPPASPDEVEAGMW